MSHRTLIDRGTGRPILMSPGREGKPRNTGPDQDGATDCPFCEGNEQLTTPENDAVREPGSTPGGPGWSARAFDNLYPATDPHEVVAEGGAHTVHPARLDRQVLADSLVLHRRRIAAAEAHEDVAVAFLFKNVGNAAGASIAHSHSQVLGLPSIPPRLELELAACEQHGCLHCREIESAEASGRLILANDSHVLISPSTPKLAHEAWLLPRDHGDDFDEPNADDGLIALLHETYACLEENLDDAAFNTWLHRLPNHDFHWHFEVQPRLGQVAALELGGDVYINAITPQASSARWRGQGSGQSGPKG